jgi:ubiquinone/menaquinone biosynthesis C-methylase UbiE
MPSHDERRRRLVSRLTGRVVEIGAGTGLTFHHYPPTVNSVVAIEPDPHRRAVADRAARGARVPIAVIDAVAEELPMPDAAADAAVASLALCSVANVTGALAELRRVLRPLGELRFLEHVLAEHGPLRLLQRAAAPVYARLPGGCHIDRETVASIVRAGFAIEACERFMHADGALEPPIPHVLGVARATANTHEYKDQP